MAKRIYILAGLALWFSDVVSAMPSPSANSHASPIGEYLRQRSSYRSETAPLELLRQVRYPSPLHPWALLESARWLYRAQRWTEFFGIAAFLRLSYPQSPLTEKVALLETLALMRHCQWGEAQSKLAWLKQSDGQGGRQSSTQSRELLDSILALVSAIPTGTTTSAGAYDHSLSVPKKFRWQAQRLDLIELDPYRLRRNVDARCVGVAE